MPLSATLTKVLDSPSIATCSFGQRAWTAKALPERFLQLRQWQTETRTGYKCEGNVCVPGELKMIDHSKGGLWTRITMRSWKLNEEFSDDLLSKRNLDK